jgi:pimeloyl-ACP methyl ester carboxylesterase
MINTSPFAALKHRAIAGKTMAYIDEGEGDAIVFQHGNPTSSYLWRNVMPHLAGLGRLIACDLIGMGESDKLSPSGPDRYHYAEQRDYLFALWDELDLGDRVVLVLHDWGSALGFDWANQHRDRVRGIAYMEALATPLQWSDVPPEKQHTFQGLGSAAGEELILGQNAFVEAVLPGSVLRELSDAEMNHYRRPFRNAGEDRRPPCRGHATFRSAASPRTSSPSSRATTAGSPKVTCPSCSSTPSRAPSSMTESEPTSGHGRTKWKRQSPVSTTSKRTAPTRSAPLSPTSSAGYARADRGGSKPRTRPSQG